MAPPTATTAKVSWAPNPRHKHDERSPHTTSQAITVPGAKPTLPIPSILLNKDRGAGRVHHYLDNITDYGPLHRHPPYKRTLPTWQDLQTDETKALVTPNNALSRQTERARMELQRNTPVHVPRPLVVVKEIDIVPECLPRCQNKREINKYWWRVEMQKRARRIVDRDSGYESDEELDRKGAVEKR
ncbi:hypothetical protein EKO04_005802 [Ascochyta lentis]|uniref:Uncharacterized protein n=1 Tax=Ascochyta lentis TaxID=205686 RepID=A0A8H7MH68_9PLEO|nr:hypothetical protein EKO04_005802 [Ascochyta lentis]